ncbi:MAG TPA: phosphohistidine phosphatase SixA [Candidatus Omnitrophota bacterium]|nr:phosphohistidine phosphatase SixA [Candidatus Omnitrophota bacterium]
MRLYLVRHGEQVPEQIDPEQPLSERGRFETAEMAAFLNYLGVRVEEIWHSSKLRAAQTAAILAEGIPHRSVVEREGMLPDDEVRELAIELEEEERDIALVGHLPFLNKLVSRLLTGTDLHPCIEFSRSGAVCLLRTDDQPWLIEWAINPSMIKTPTR